MGYDDAELELIYPRGDTWLVFGYRNGDDGHAGPDRIERSIETGARDDQSRTLYESLLRGPVHGDGVARQRPKVLRQEPAATERKDGLHVQIGAGVGD